MDTKKFNLAMNVLKYAVGIVGAIACLWVWGTSPGSDISEIAKKEYADTPQMSMAIYYTITVIAVAVGCILIFFAFQMITNTKKTLLSILGVIIALVVYFILRMIGTTDTNESLQLANEKFVSDGTLASITAGLYTVLIGIAIGFLVALLGPLFLGKYRK